jgi:hypothetical protein
VGTINLRPLANINYATCNAAVVPNCGPTDQTITIPGVANINLSLCRP